MTKLREAAQAALEALEQLQGGCTDHDDGAVEAITVWCPEVIDALRTALAQTDEPAQPVAWMLPSGHGVLLRAGATNPAPGVEWPAGSGVPIWIPLYTADAIREAVLAERERCLSIVHRESGSSSSIRSTVEAIQSGGAA